MSIAVHIALEGEPAGATAVFAEAIARHSEEFEQLEERLGLRSLASFVSSDPEYMEDILAGIRELGLEVPVPEVLGLKMPEKEEWFAPEEGLETIQRLLEHLRTHPNDLPEGDLITEELDAFHRILSQATHSKTRWHLAVIL